MNTYASRGGESDADIGRMNSLFLQRLVRAADKEHDQTDPPVTAHEGRVCHYFLYFRNSLQRAQQLLTLSVWELD